ncbi:MAG: serine hydrolase domain-containing protein, partial [Vicinamibacterales bacterium]
MGKRRLSTGRRDRTVRRESLTHNAARLYPLLMRLLLALAIACTLRANSLADFDAFAEAVRKGWNVPGAAVAIVKDGKVILSKGYGFRDTAKQLPVTPETLFAIGSITKSFTVVALGTLVDEKKLDWDKRVREYLSDFQLHDAVATERMTPRDLVTHRSGLPRHDMVWYGGSLSRQQMYERLRHLEFSRDFRAQYQYNNLMFMTAGVLAGKVAGSTWEELIRRRILDPLGMRHSNFSVRDSQRAP